jgi:hypothetical protein
MPADNEPSRFLVTGASGNVGGAVVTPLKWCDPHRRSTGNGWERNRS